jgi:hypothetical protein
LGDDACGYPSYIGKGHKALLALVRPAIDFGQFNISQVIRI